MITESATLIKVAEYKINFGCLNEAVNIGDLEDECWRCAIEDGLVDQKDRKKYTITVV